MLAFLWVSFVFAHKIFFVWYPKFFQKSLSYKARDCLYKKMPQTSLARGAPLGDTSWGGGTAHTLLNLVGEKHRLGGGQQQQQQ